MTDLADGDSSPLSILDKIRYNYRMIKFNVRVSKIANHYFFIQNLSEWHSRNKRKSNRYWIRQYGSLSRNEKFALRSFKKLRRRYPSTRSIFDRAFFSTTLPWETLKNKLSKKEFDQMKNIFHLFNPRFETLYSNQKHRLFLWKKKLGQSLDRSSTTPSIIQILNQLYSTRVSKEKVTIYLIFSSPLEVGGGANIDDRSLSLEISSLPLTESKRVESIVWHEMIHLCFEREHFIPLLIKTFGEKSSFVHHYLELMASSLFPNGLLGHRFFQSYSSGRLSSILNKKFNNQLLDIVNQTMASNKTFDRIFIHKIKHLLLKI